MNATDNASQILIAKHLHLGKNRQRRQTRIKNNNEPGLGLKMGQN
jgi:hypothetical protein